MLLLAPLYSPRTKTKHRQMVQLLPFHYFLRKNCTVPSGGKFSPVFSQKESAPVFLLGQHDNEVNDVISCNVSVKFLILMFVNLK